MARKKRTNKAFQRLDEAMGDGTGKRKHPDAMFMAEGGSSHMKKRDEAYMKAKHKGMKKSMPMKGEM